ncbi:unnamed protein product [Enterobius vermicularis]|uniref:EB domain-containing protein n=1 Tax=Enterobius vermicularis TaxID=51028 RepID=A0A0N4UZP0_ENTVE|nr:unnamed protein product [Enterobius vermicularis]
MINEPMIQCPKGTFCEERTGFCCGIDSATTVDLKRPKVGEKCSPIEGCMGNAACICADAKNCTCQCPSEFGYSLDVDGIHCKRLRRRLKEKCKTNAECQAAYSECTSGGCRCKIGFQRDKNGGCKPTAYRCANKLEPLKKGEKIRTCKLDPYQNGKQEDTEDTGSVKPNQSKLYNNEFANDGTLFEKTTSDDCPNQYYCVPLFDHPKTGLLQVFGNRFPLYSFLSITRTFLKLSS